MSFRTLTCMAVPDLYPTRSIGIINCRLPRGTGGGGVSRDTVPLVIGCTRMAITRSSGRDNMKSQRKWNEIYHKRMNNNKVTVKSSILIRVINPKTLTLAMDS